MNWVYLSLSSKFGLNHEFDPAWSNLTQIWTLRLQPDCQLGWDNLKITVWEHLFIVYLFAYLLYIFFGKTSDLRRGHVAYFSCLSHSDFAMFIL